MTLQDSIKYLGRKGYLFVFSALLVLVGLILVGACVVLTIKTSPTPADFAKIFSIFANAVMWLFGLAVGGNGVEHIAGALKPTIEQPKVE
jgi:sulfite exporter TauE/SafE